MKCPICDSYNVHVIDSRPVENNMTHRRLYCDECGGRFCTEESVTKIKQGKKYITMEMSTGKEKRAYKQGIEDAMEAVQDLLGEKS